MRQLYHHTHEGFRFSRNGHRAYLRGEKPLWMWQNQEIEEAVAHHVEWGAEPYVRRSLVMFYKLKQAKT